MADNTFGFDEEERDRDAQAGTGPSYVSGNDINPDTGRMYGFDLLGSAYDPEYPTRILRNDPNRADPVRDRIITPGDRETSYGGDLTRGYFEGDAPGQFGFGEQVPVDPAYLAYQEQPTPNPYTADPSQWGDGQWVTEGGGTGGTGTGGGRTGWENGAPGAGGTGTGGGGRGTGGGTTVQPGTGPRVTTGPYVYGPDAEGRIDRAMTNIEQMAATQMNNPSRWNSDLMQQGMDVIANSIANIRQRGQTGLSERFANRGLTGSSLEAQAFTDYEGELQRLADERAFELGREVANTYGDDVARAFGFGSTVAGLAGGRTDADRSYGLQNWGMAIQERQAEQAAQLARLQSVLAAYGLDIDPEVLREALGITTGSTGGPGGGNNTTTTRRRSEE